MHRHSWESWTSAAGRDEAMFGGDEHIPDHDAGDGTSSRGPATSTDAVQCFLFECVFVLRQSSLLRTRIRIQVTFSELRMAGLQGF